MHCTLRWHISDSAGCQGETLQTIDLISSFWHRTQYLLSFLALKYMFPYNWSFNLCMTFGAILSGTDPVAVAGLLNALGAPPRLKMHICGESLLNDGSAVVFYNIFSARFFYELSIPGFGQDYTWGKGFAAFFRLSLGGCAIGLAFGLGAVLLLKMLSRRLSEEENVMQVVALTTIAYLAYFVAEILSGCSGIIATIACGLTVKVFGEPLLNDSLLTLHFFQVLGELLNTLLFVLGGTLWGNIISGDDANAFGKYHGTFAGKVGELHTLFCCRIPLFRSLCCSTIQGLGILGTSVCHVDYNPLCIGVWILVS